MCEALILRLPKGDKLINKARSQVAQRNVALDEPEVKRTNDREFGFNYFTGVSLAREEAPKVVYKQTQGSTPQLRDGC